MRWIYIVFQYLITDTVHFQKPVGYETTKKGAQQPNSKEERKERIREKKTTK